MTVYPDANAARIDPAVLTKTALPAHLRRWFDEAHIVYKGDQSYAYKAGYLHTTLCLIESYLKAAAQTEE